MNYRYLGLRYVLGKTGLGYWYVCVETADTVWTSDDHYDKAKAIEAAKQFINSLLLGGTNETSKNEQRPHLPRVDDPLHGGTARGYLSGGGPAA